MSLENPTPDVSWTKTVENLIFQAQIEYYMDRDSSLYSAEIKKDTTLTRQKVAIDFRRLYK